MCSASMKTRAISEAVNARSKAKANDKPSCQVTAANSAAVRASTAGYRREILAPQERHRPRRARKLRIGMLSYGLIALRHFGQVELGKTIDCSSGKR